MLNKINDKFIGGPLNKVNDNYIAPALTNNVAKPLSNARPPDAVGVRWAHSGSAGAGYATSTDFLVSKNGVNAYGSIEGNAGLQAGVDFSSQVVFAWGTEDGIAGKYRARNVTFATPFGGLDIAYSWSDTSKVFAIGPCIGGKFQYSEGIGMTVH